jgi:hypothetical protein
LSVSDAPAQRRSIRAFRALVPNFEHVRNWHIADVPAQLR